jgi:hypothetical protein
MSLAYELQELKRLEFDDRHSYFTWRHRWRGGYAKLSAEIREHKRFRRPGIEGAPSTPDHHQSLAALWGNFATRMLEARAASKMKAGQLRQRVLQENADSGLYGSARIYEEIHAT